MPRYTAMFHLSVHEAGAQRALDSRPFIGDVDEAVDELREEYDHWFPGDAAKKGRDYWRQRRFELTMTVEKSTQVVARDHGKGRTLLFRMEQSGPYYEVDEHGKRVEE